MKKKILINGYFHCYKLTGIERYAIEITKRLDRICEKDEISLIIPKNISNVPKYKNINVIEYGIIIKKSIWQLLTLQWFLFINRQYTILEYGNFALPFFPGIVFLHDIYCELFIDDFSSIKEKIIRIYNCWQYRLIAKKSRHIITVSEYSKKEIYSSFNINPARITVIYSSADHFKTIKSDYSVFIEFPIINEKSFYFSLGSLSKRKNINWIISAARKNPDSFFAISGSSLPTLKADELDNEIPSNIILLGYLNDEKVKALMHRCKAFILPSYYEGFGLTPLEALSCGAKIIISNAASLPEIYGNSAHYIDPFNTDIDLDKLLQEPVENSDKLFEKYSYDKSAKQVYNIIKESIDNGYNNYR